MEHDRRYNAREFPYSVTQLKTGFDLNELNTSEYKIDDIATIIYAAHLWGEKSVVTFHNKHQVNYEQLTKLSKLINFRGFKTSVDVIGNLLTLKVFW